MRNILVAVLCAASVAGAAWAQERLSVALDVSRYPPRGRARRTSRKTRRTDPDDREYTSAASRSALPPSAPSRALPSRRRWSGSSSPRSSPWGSTRWVYDTGFRGRHARRPQAVQRRRGRSRGRSRLPSSTTRTAACARSPAVRRRGTSCASGRATPSSRSWRARRRWSRSPATWGKFQRSWTRARRSRNGERGQE